MVVIFKNESGTFSVRPAYIGFIKHDFTRRFLCTLFYPLVVLFTVVINLIQAAFVSVVLFVRAFWHPLSRLKSIKDTEIWHRPRTKNDFNKTMD